MGTAKQVAMYGWGGGAHGCVMGCGLVQATAGNALRYLEVLGAPIYGPCVDQHEPNRSKLRAELPPSCKVKGGVSTLTWSHRAGGIGSAVPRVPQVPAV